MTQAAARILLTVPEVADELRVSRHTVYRLIERGVLRKVDLDAGQVTEGKAHRTRVRVRRADLDAYLELKAS